MFAAIVLDIALRNVEYICFGKDYLFLTKRSCFTVDIGNAKVNVKRTRRINQAEKFTMIAQGCIFKIDALTCVLPNFLRKHLKIPT